MTYELVKTLKNAGFPQTGEHFDSNGDLYGWSDDVYYPTLSELIFACGDRFMQFTKIYQDDGIHWLAMDVEREFIETQRTPEDAVAKLWLALKSSDVSEEKSSGEPELNPPADS